MNAKRMLTVLSAAVFPLAVVMLLNGPSGCKKEETEAPPPPTAAPTPTPTPTPVTTVTPEEDAGADAADAADGDASDAKPGSGSFDPTGIKKCCSALRQNAKSAPLDQQGGYLAAASVCDGLTASAQSRQALAGLRQFLRGAQLPSACQ